jgi:MFS family permease
LGDAGAFYYRILVPKHPELKRELGKPFVVIYLVFGLAYAIGATLGYTRSLADFYTYYFLNLGHLKFFLYALLGLAPFIGFTLAALRDLFYKVKRGEELSQLLIIGLLGSLLTLSLVFPFLLIFLTAKQVQNFFKIKNYPWQDWVKAGQVLHLVLVFMLVVLALLGGYVQFQIDGFRAVLGCSAAYWMFSFLGVIGLYGQRRDQVLGGTVLAGLIALLFFWIQVYPFIHLQRNWPQRLQTQIEKTLPDTKTIGIDSADPLTLPLAPYLSRAGYTVNPSNIVNQDDLFIRRLEAADSLLTPKVEVEGWAGLWGAERWGGS